MSITQKDLLERIAKKQIDPSDLPSRRLSQSQVIIELKNKQKFDVMSAPTGYEYDGIVDSLLTSFTFSDYCIRLQINERATRNNAIKSFFSYVTDNDNKWSKNTSTKHREIIHKELPIQSVQSWFEHLKQTETSISCWRKMVSVLRTLTFTLQKRYGKFSNWPLNQKKIYKEFEKLAPKNPKSEKSPPLGKYLGIPSNHFTNRELLMGLRYGAIWLLNKLNHQRVTFLSQSEISSAFQSFKNRTTSEFRQTFSNWQLYYSHAATKNSPIRQIWASINPACWKVISSDPLLCEWQCYCWTELRNRISQTTDERIIPLTAKSQHNLISNFINPNGTTRVCIPKSSVSFPEWQNTEKLFSKSISIRTPCRWGTDWYSHTDLEIVLMSWLLSTERAQPSGIQSLTFNDVNISETVPNTLQISTIKLRRTSNSKKTSSQVESTIYRRNDPPFLVYKRWLERELLMNAHLVDFNVSQKYIHGPKHLINGDICLWKYKRFPSSILPLELLSISGTVWQNTFLEETPESGMREANAFIAILKSRIQKKRDFPRLRVSLPSSPIGQSLVVEQQRGTNKVSPFSFVEADVSGHSESTARNIYKAGFYKIGVEEIVEPIRAFARRVGDEKIKLANIITDRLSNSQRKITLLELEEICGIKSSISVQADLLSHLDNQDKLLISGTILNGDELLIVETEITAGLMWGYIKHIESNLPGLLSSPREQTTIEFLAKLINLHQIFDGFPMNLQQSGKRLAEEMDFCFPPII